MTEDATSSALDHDVIVVGGGPAGATAAVFTARYGLDTVVFDRGNAALSRCAFLSNYLGFPGGIDIETFYDLMHAHVQESGAAQIGDMVISIERIDENPGFVIQTQDDRMVTTRYVVAATWYDGEYLKPVCGEDTFETHDHHGELEERFDPEYPDSDGRTQEEGLYVAAPNDGRNAQAIVSAGQGAHVARSLLEDHRSVRGFPEGVLGTHYDWLRPESEFEGEWGDRERWRAWFENEASDDHDLEAEQFEALKEAYIDRAFETKLSASEIEARTQRGIEELVETIGADRVLDAMARERIMEYLDTRPEPDQR